MLLSHSERIFLLLCLSIPRCYDKEYKDTCQIFHNFYEKKKYKNKKRETGYNRTLSGYSVTSLTVHHGIDSVQHYPIVIQKNYKKTGCGPPYSQLWQEKTLEVRGDLIAIKIEERAS